METNGEILHPRRNEEGKGMVQAPYKRYLHAVTPRQKNSLAELKETYKYALYEDVTTENRENYFDISVRPITKKQKMIWSYYLI